MFSFLNLSSTAEMGGSMEFLNASIADSRASNYVRGTFNILRKYLPDVTGTAQTRGRLLLTTAP